MKTQKYYFICWECCIYEQLRRYNWPFNLTFNTCNKKFMSIITIPNHYNTLIMIESLYASECLTHNRNTGAEEMRIIERRILRQILGWKSRKGIREYIYRPITDTKGETPKVWGYVYTGLIKRTWECIQIQDQYNLDETNYKCLWLSRYDHRTYEVQCHIWHIMRYTLQI